MYVELNIDAIVGPSHHFGGVGVGNEASRESERKPSYPRRAALEGLSKAMLIAELGVPQYVLPPLRRPLMPFLTRLGFNGDFASQCEQARRLAPAAYSATFSSAYMWAANAATVAPASDCSNHQTNLTLANLSSSWHRMFEQLDREPQIASMFASSLNVPVCIHSALPPMVPLRDEGAANHMRLCNAAGDIGFHVFVYGQADEGMRPTRHMARQTLAASQAVARLHGLDPARTFFLQQHPDAIDAGVFHNDVIATSHRNLLLMHEQAFVNAQDELQRLSLAFNKATGTPLKIVVVRPEQLTLAEAVRCYLFNSQIVTPAHNPNADPNRMVIICAGQCQEMPAARKLIQEWILAADNPIEDVRYVSLDQSMSGGGGPACLRLRMSLPAQEIRSFAPAYRLTPALMLQLTTIIEQCYPERLDWESLALPENLDRYEQAFGEYEKLFRTSS